MAQMIKRISNSLNGARDLTSLGAGRLKTRINYCQSINITTPNIFSNTHISGPGTAGGGTIGGGYLQMMVITSSPAISKLGWNRTTILLVNTRAGLCKRNGND
jgi:hypothetical protein